MRAPTLIASRIAAPQGGAFRLGAAQRRNTAPTLIASRIAAPRGGAAAPSGGRAVLP